MMICSRGRVPASTSSRCSYATVDDVSGIGGTVMAKRDRWVRDAQVLCGAYSNAQLDKPQASAWGARDSDAPLAPPSRAS